MRTDGGGGHAAGVGQPLLHPHGRVQEAFHAEVAEDGPEVSAHLAVGRQLPLQATLLGVLQGRAAQGLEVFSLQLKDSKLNRQGNLMNIRPTSTLYHFILYSLCSFHSLPLPMTTKIHIQSSPFLHSLECS